MYDDFSILSILDGNILVNTLSRNVFYEYIYLQMWIE